MDRGGGGGDYCTTTVSGRRKKAISLPVASAQDEDGPRRVEGGLNFRATLLQIVTQKLVGWVDEPIYRDLKYVLCCTQGKSFLNTVGRTFFVPPLELALYSVRSRLQSAVCVSSDSVVRVATTTKTVALTLQLEVLISKLTDTQAGDDTRDGVHHVVCRHKLYCNNYSGEE